MNGTRHIVTQIGKRLIKAQIAGGGPYDGNEILIPRILFHPEDKNLPFEFERCQFPVRVCGGMTANKAQGQGFSRVGIYLKNDFFSHGQCYSFLDISFEKVIFTDFFRQIAEFSTRKYREMARGTLWNDLFSQKFREIEDKQRVLRCEK